MLTRLRACRRRRKTKPKKRKLFSGKIIKESQPPSLQSSEDDDGNMNNRKFRQTCRTSRKEEFSKQFRVSKARHTRTARRGNTHLIREEKVTRRVMSVLFVEQKKVLKGCLLVPKVIITCHVSFAHYHLCERRLRGGTTSEAARQKESLGAIM